MSKKAIWHKNSTGIPFSLFCVGHLWIHRLGVCSAVWLIHTQRPTHTHTCMYTILRTYNNIYIHPLRLCCRALIFLHTREILEFWRGRLCSRSASPLLPPFSMTNLDRLAMTTLPLDHQKFFQDLPVPPLPHPLWFSSRHADVFNSIFFEIKSWWNGHSTRRKTKQNLSEVIFPIKPKK